MCDACSGFLGHDPEGCVQCSHRPARAGTGSSMWETHGPLSLCQIQCPVQDCATFNAHWASQGPTLHMFHVLDLLEWAPCAAHIPDWPEWAPIWCSPLTSRNGCHGQCASQVLSVSLVRHTLHGSAMRSKGSTGGLLNLSCGLPPI